MLDDGSHIMDLMPYSLFKKFGSLDEKLVKTNMTISGVGGGNPIGTKGATSMGSVIGYMQISAYLLLCINF